MQKLILSVCSLMLLVATVACRKPETYDSLSICNDPEALNYEQRYGCVYVKQELDGRSYDVVITRNDQDPGTVGTKMTFKVYDGSILTNRLDMTERENIGDFEVKLTGYDFSFPANQIITRWQLLYELTGSGSLANDQFILNGIIHDQDTAYVLTLSGSVHKSQ